MPARRLDSSSFVRQSLTPDPVALTQALVRVNTSNPPGNEAPATAVLRARLEELGARCRVLEPAPGRASLIAEVVGDPGDFSLGVCGHLDTVTAERDRWSVDPFAAAITDGRLYGLGAVDMKGGVAASVEALATLRARRIPPAWTLRFFLVADEEAGSSLGAATLAGRGELAVDAAVVTEPTRLQACCVERGVVWVRFDVLGRSAHASRPRLGRSAIAAAAFLTQAIEDSRGDGLRSGHSVNVGVINGGSQPNIVAGKCTVRADVRISSGETAEAVSAWAQAHADEVAKRKDVSISVEVEEYSPGTQTDPGNALGRFVQAALSPAAARHDLRATTDARFFRRCGVPTIVWGPGDMDAAHTADEWVEVTQLTEAATRLAELYAKAPSPSWQHGLRPARHEGPSLLRILTGLSKGTREHDRCAGS